MSEEKKQKSPTWRKRRFRFPKKFYQKQFINIFLIVAVILFFLAILNIFLNQKNTQLKLADFLKAKAQISVNFDDIELHLFTGTLSGEDIALDFQKNNLFLSLKHFKVHFNPVLLLLGKIKINAVAAEQIYLDTSQLTKIERKQGPKNLPEFLKNIQLKRADIDEFSWNQGETGFLFVDKVRIQSRFGSLFYKSPTTMVIQNVKYIGHKVHIFADELMQDGFFIFDLSQPRILDESKITSNIQLDNILLAFNKRKKEWLTNPGWDKDLTPTLKKYYGNTIPEDKSYLFVRALRFDFEKTKHQFKLHYLLTQIHDAQIKAKGTYNERTNHFSFLLQTQQAVSFSKLPFGQAQIRQAFERFQLKLKMEGKYKNLNNNKITTGLNIELLGNQTHPDAKKVDIQLKGQIQNSVLEVLPLLIKTQNGQISAQGQVALQKGEPNLNFTCNDFDAQTIIGLFSTIKIPTIADCKGSLSGTFTNPNIQVSMNSQDTVYEFLHFGPAQANLNLQNKKLKLNVQTTSTEVGQSQLQMSIQNVFDSFSQVIQLNSKHQNVDIQKLLNAKSMEGKASGTFELNRKNTTNTAKGHFDVKQFVFFEKNIGNLSTDLKLRQKHLELTPIRIELKKTDTTLTSHAGLTFDFDEFGYRFSGKPLPGVEIKGNFAKANRNYLNVTVLAQNTALKLFSPFLPLEAQDSKLSGQFNVKYHIYEPLLSSMQGQIRDLTLQMPEGNLVLSQPARVGFQHKAFQLYQMKLKSDLSLFQLDGALGLIKNSNLRLSGNVDLNVISDFNPFIAETEKPIQLDLTFKGDIFKPLIFGRVHFKNDALRFRNFYSDFTDMNGDVVFDGSQITFKTLRFFYDDAPMQANGYIVTDYEDIRAADLKLIGQEIPLHLENGFNTLADMNLTLKGQFPPTLSGKINIVDGQYNQDFGITNFILKPQKIEIEEETKNKFGILSDHTKLNLRIQNTGDFIISNNIAELEMQADLEMVGTIASPVLLGQIDFVTGEINAFGVNFEDATGYAQFTRKQPLNPEVHLIAKKEIQEYEIRARLQGQLENLRLRLDSTPSLDRREILSVLFYGQTPDLLVGEKRHQFTQTAAISQLASVLSKPLNQISGLDVMEVSGRQESSNETIQRLSVGKSLSRRFNLLFTTDIGIEDPERAFELEYQIFDNFYFISAKDIGDRDRYRFDVSFRLKWY